MSDQPIPHLKQLGEFGLIQRIQPPLYNYRNKVLKSIGDDCSVVEISKDEVQLISTDILVEGIHFLFPWISPAQLGRKALTVNLSDIAAMGGEPESVYLSIAIPDTISTKEIDEFYSAFLSMAKDFKVELLGGDTTGSIDYLFISVTIIGRAKKSQVKYRHGAEEGDLIVVTKPLGDSAAGFDRLRFTFASEIYENTEIQKRLIQKHLEPEPESDLGIYLGGHDSVTSMIDLSDGLVSDLGHICDASVLGAVIDAERLPCSNDLSSYEPDLDKRLEFQLQGGEDYGLLFTIPKKAFQAIAEGVQRKLGRELYPIGNMTYGNGIILNRDSARHPLQFKGFKHF